MSYVDRTLCPEAVQSIAHAREAGTALGLFHYLISDLDPKRLHDTLPGFHVTPRYLAHYDRVLADRAGRVPHNPLVEYGLRTVERFRRWGSVLEDAHARGELRMRPIHGDPKINNILVDEQTGQAVSLIDLDTVKPGLVHYDIGDCLRSCCNPLGEGTTRFDEVQFDLDLCRAILDGYLSVAAGFLDAHDIAYLYDCTRLIAFELGLRFFTDHLEGDVYFKVSHRQENLHRGLVQLKLAESIAAQEDEIRAIVDELRYGD
jgi:Ser/Thr protein kinase RdoA (MazF antagonist)